MKEDYSTFFKKLAVLFAAYVLTAKIGLSFGAFSGFATLVWPPTGIALAALLIWGYRYSPAIFLGAAFVNYWSGAQLLVATGIGLGNMLEALTGTYFLNKSKNFDFSLEKVDSVVKLVFYAAIISTVISATFGSTSLFLGRIITSSTYPVTWFTWWIGDALGVVTVASLILVWYQRLRKPILFRRLLSSVVPLLLLIAVAITTFRGLPSLGIGPLRYLYVIFPVFVWIALKFGQRGSVIATFIASLIAIWGTVTNTELASGDLAQRLLAPQGFIGITAVTFMTMAAVVAERERNRERQQNLLQKTAMLTKQRARLKALNKAKDDFISIASHQLRTPATSVKQYLGMLQQGYVGRLGKLQSTYIDVAYSSNERQLKIINDLLNVARLDAGKLQLKKKKCNLNQLITSVVSQQIKSYENRSQNLIFTPAEKPIFVRADKGFLQMVIEIIIDNASKYSPHGESVVIEAAKNGNRAEIRVNDNGIGISKTNQKKLFKKFSRIEDNRASTTDGSGLGLYWAKSIIKLHGGNIKLNSNRKKGTTFIISLPVN